MRKLFKTLFLTLILTFTMVIPAWADTTTTNSGATITTTNATVPSDVTQLETYLNTNFNALDVNGSVMHFNWRVNNPKVTDTIDVELVALINPQDTSYYNWLTLCMNGHSDTLHNDFMAILNKVQSVYPTKSMFVMCIYDGYYVKYPEGYKSNDVSYDSNRNEWRVFTDLVDIFDTDGLGGNNPVVLK